jgi:uncharacterized protein YbaA (DUF1428 family)
VKNLTYVDGFVLVVEKKNLASYKKMAQMGSKLWKKYGALHYFECQGDDLIPNTGGDMKILDFPKLTKVKPTETVWFSFIIYKSKAHRNKVNSLVMKDPIMNDPKWAKSMPFDPKKMAYGGFKAIVGF